MTGAPDPAYRVVIADDVEDLRYLLKRALERDGRFSVVGLAANGREAVVQAARLRPDLTLLDLSMPVMDGLEALPLIRSAVPEGTVVVLSGLDAERMESAALGRGAAGFLVKGLSPRRLVDELTVLLGRLEQPPPITLPADPADAAEVARAHIGLPPDLSSAAQARSFLRGTLPSWSLSSLIDSALLLTTELVTNAVIHARSPVGVTLKLTGDRLRVEVADHGPGALIMREPVESDTFGRGLQLLEALSSAWGTSADEQGKLVWFELPIVNADR
jgi:DNA-binding NarL/FixJ family response regulator/anti-sigma regulatory factor (Ser/Thr protein kinase)